MRSSRCLPGFTPRRLSRSPHLIGQRNGVKLDQALRRYDVNHRRVGGDVDGLISISSSSARATIKNHRLDVNTVETDDNPFRVLGHKQRIRSTPKYGSIQQLRSESRHTLIP